MSNRPIYLTNEELRSIILEETLYSAEYAKAIKKLEIEARRRGIFKNDPNERRARGDFSRGKS